VSNTIKQARALIDWAKPVQDQHGHSWRILATDGTYPGYPIIAEKSSTGSVCQFCIAGNDGNSLQLSNKPELREIWINVYDGWSLTYDTRQAADSYADITRRARIKLEVPIGRFDE
jgi:hypothetical protein